MEEKSFKLGGDGLLENADYKIINGKKYWRVTSIISTMNPPSHTVPLYELKQYAARGTLAHLEASLILGKGVSLQEKRECEKILAEGSLKLQPINPKIISNFIAQYPEFKWGEAQVELFMWNDELEVCGTCDLVLPMGQARQKVIADWKTASSYGNDKKVSYFKQLAAYSLLLPPHDRAEVAQGYIFPLNPRNKSGYGSPIICNELERYQKLFLRDLEKFKLLHK